MRTIIRSSSQTAKRIMGISLIAFSAAAFAQEKPEFTGDFGGLLNGLHVQLHLVKGPHGTLSATVDDPDQGMMGMACTNVVANGRSLSFSVPKVNGAWAGFLSSDGNSLTGMWNQGAPAALNMTRISVLNSAPSPETVAASSDDGRPRKVLYNGQNYFVEQSPGGFSLKITPEGTPVPIGIVDIRRGRVTAMNPGNYDTVKGVYDAYKSSGSTFSAPEQPAVPARIASPDLSAASAPAERAVTFSDAGALVKDPRYGQVTISNDGTEASYVTEDNHGVSTVPAKTIVSYEGGDAPPSDAEKAGKFAKGAGTTLLYSMSPRVTTRVGTHGNDVWKVVGEGVHGKNTMYESGSSAQGVMAANGRDPGKDIGLTILESMKLDIDAAVKAAAAKKDAGEVVKFDVSGERSQRALKSLQEATKAFDLK